MDLVGESFGSAGLIFVAIGGVSAIAAVLLAIRSRRFLSSGVAVQGTVMDVVASSSSRGGTVYKPVIQFTTVEGQTHTFTDMVGTSPPRYAPGQTVEVMYPPGDPTAARIPSGFRMWFLPGFAALFGVVFLAVGIPMTLGDDAREAAGDLSDIPVPSIAPGDVPTGVLPSGLDLDGLPTVPSPGSGESILVIGQGGDPPRPVTAACVSLRELQGGAAREVRLRFEGGSLTFRATPYTGPGPYLAGQNLVVGGSVFEPGAELSGAVIFEESERAGVLNLVSGSTLANGSWGCPKGT